MIPVALGLGCNKAFDGLEPIQILGGAVQRLSGLFKGLEYSSVYKTRAMYYLDQDDFYNMAVLGFVDDGADPFELLAKTQKIEAAFGRDRSKEIRNGPRSLDIDMELFGSKSINAENLLVPHPRLKERAFVLVPLVEILAKDADNIKWKAFGSKNILELRSAHSTLCGREAPTEVSCGVELYMDAKAFSYYINEEQYGTRNSTDG